MRPRDDNTSVSPTPKLHPATKTPRHRWIVYWATTAVIVAECLVGGTYDLLRLRPFFPMLAQLGYPAYLATILGVAKILAGVALAVPGFARLKEWAYAGIMINMLGAAASWIAVRHGPSDFVPPLAFGAIAFLSWVTRPPGRRLGRDPDSSSVMAVARTAFGHRESRITSERPDL